MFRDIEDIDTAAKRLAALLHCGCVPVEDNANLYRIPYTASGDYTGSLVEASNRQSLIEEHESFLPLETVSYMFGTEELVYSMESDKHNEWNEDKLYSFLSFFEQVCGLENYPLIDDDLHSQMEWDAYVYAWEDWGRADTVISIRKAMPDLPHFVGPDSVSLETYADNWMQDNSGAFWGDWMHSEGIGFWIDCDKFAAAMVEDLKG
jgi:hypothetical protein